MNLKMTFYTQIKALLRLFFVICFFILLFIYLDLVQDLKFYLYVILPLILIFVAPVLIIHINYYLESRKVSYEIYKEKIYIIVKDKKLTYHIGEIKEIIFYMTANKLKDSASSNFLYDYYYYAKIIFFNNDETIITCLHSDNIDQILRDNLNDVDIVKIKTFYPIIPLRRRGS